MGWEGFFVQKDLGHEFLFWSTNGMSERDEGETENKKVEIMIWDCKGGRYLV